MQQHGETIWANWNLKVTGYSGYTLTPVENIRWRNYALTFRALAIAWKTPFARARRCGDFFRAKRCNRSAFSDSTCK